MKRKDIRAEIKRIQNWYGGRATDEQLASHLNISVEELREIIDPKPVAKSPPKRQPRATKKPETKSSSSIPIRVVKLIAAILASFGALMSWYYSYEWSKNSLPAFWKVILPLLIVGCSSLFPEIAIILFGKKGWKTKVASGVVLCTGLIATGFSMMSTVAGIYNANTAIIEKKSVAINSANSYIDSKDEANRLREEIDRLNREIDNTQAKIDSIPVEDVAKTESQALVRRVKDAKTQKAKYEGELSATAKRIEAIRSSGGTAETVRADFASFVGRVFGVEAGVVEFALASAPAILIDIVVPILMAVALFL